MMLQKNRTYTRGHSAVKRRARWPFVTFLAIALLCVTTTTFFLTRISTNSAMTTPDELTPTNDLKLPLYGFSAQNLLHHVAERESAVSLAETSADETAISIVGEQDRAIPVIEDGTGIPFHRAHPIPQDNQRASSSSMTLRTHTMEELPSAKGSPWTEFAERSLNCPGHSQRHSQRNLVDLCHRNDIQSPSLTPLLRKHLSLDHPGIESNPKDGCIKDGDVTKCTMILSGDSSKSKRSPNSGARSRRLHTSRLLDYRVDVIRARSIHDSINWWLDRNKTCSHQTDKNMIVQCHSRTRTSYLLFGLLVFVGLGLFLMGIILFMDFLRGKRRQHPMKERFAENQIYPFHQTYDAENMLAGHGRVKDGHLNAIEERCEHEEVPEYRYVTVDVAADGWTRWIHKKSKQKAPVRNCLCPHSRPPRIPTLRLPQPTFASMRKTNGVGLQGSEGSMGFDLFYTLRGKSRSPTKLKWTSIV